MTPRAGRPCPRGSADRHHTPQPRLARDAAAPLISAAGTCEKPAMRAAPAVAAALRLDLFLAPCRRPPASIPHHQGNPHSGRGILRLWRAMPDAALGVGCVGCVGCAPPPTASGPYLVIQRPARPFRSLSRKAEPKSQPMHSPRAANDFPPADRDGWRCGCVRRARIDIPPARATRAGAGTALTARIARTASCWPRATGCPLSGGAPGSLGVGQQWWVPADRAGGKRRCRAVVSQLSKKSLVPQGPPAVQRRIPWGTRPRFRSCV